MALLDSLIGRAFRDESAGRVVVFSGDRPGRGYLLKSPSDELRIRSFLKMFYFAEISILILGMLVANAWSTFFANLEGFGRPAEHVLRSIAIYLANYSLLVWLPYFLLWRSYKKALPTFVSPQDAVEGLGKSPAQKSWPLIAGLVAFGLMALFAALVLLVRHK